MTIVLHIGVSKTGSSAIQYALAKYQSELSALGVHYGLKNRDAVLQGRLVTSGNGAPLVLRLDPRRGKSAESEQLDFESAYITPDHPVSLISSEGLSSADPELLAQFRRETIGDRDVRIIAFVRDLYGHAASSWMQRIKRHGYTGRFERFCRKSYGAKPCKALRTYAEVFGPERITVIHYDSVRGKVFQALLQALDLPAEGMDAPPHINRSLSQAEVEVLIACNTVHKDLAQLSARISDHLIYKHPDRPSHPVFSPAAAAVLEERFRPDVDWVNATFFAGAEVLKIGGPAEAEADADLTPHEEIWGDAMEAVAKRLTSVEAQNRRLIGEVDRLKAQSWTDLLKLDLTRRFRRSSNGAA
jgi:hypothetical protein